MTMEVAWFSVPVTPMEEHRYGKEPGWMESMRSRAAEMLAHFILRENKSLFRRIEPTEEQLRINPAANIHYQWSVGVESSLDDIAAREAQIEQGRRAGLVEAAAIVNAAGERYSKLDGGCAGVIASALFDAARAIQKS